MIAQSSCTSMANRGLKPAAVLAAQREHGDRLKYIAGCRCEACRRANTLYETARALARKSGDWNGVVPADKARKHMLKLSRQGVGRRAIQAVTDIADTILSGIRTGAKKNIRARTERLILAVTKEMASDHALIDARETWLLINKLLARGYNKSQIALALGSESATPALQIRTDQITVRTAHAVKRLYEREQRDGFVNGVSGKREPDPDLPRGTYSPRPGWLIHRMEG